MSQYTLYLSPASKNTLSNHSLEIGAVNELSMEKGNAIVSCSGMHESLIKTVYELEYVTVSLSGKINFNAKVEGIEVVSRAIFIGNVENPNNVFLSFDCVFHFSEVVFK